MESALSHTWNVIQGGPSLPIFLISCPSSISSYQHNLCFPKPFFKRHYSV